MLDAAASHAKLPYEAILVISFGGPEKMEDVMPFLRRVVRGKPVPQERLEEVASHYYHFGGVSPINSQCRELIAAMQDRLRLRSWSLPIYWGNRNWHPFLEDTVRQMAEDGVARAVAVITSAYSSYSSCRQYLENIATARNLVGPRAPQIDRIRPYFNHPAFIDAWTDRLSEARRALPDHHACRPYLVFTAHSIPLAMARNCDYQIQLNDVATTLASRIGMTNWSLVYQSRSGPPDQAWLEPDVCDFVRTQLAEQEVTHLIAAPIGFLSDHIEVLYDLDVELKTLCDQIGITLIRAQTIGAHPRFVEGLLDLVEERLGLRADRPVIGTLPPRPLDCPTDCCPGGRNTSMPSRAP